MRPFSWVDDDIDDHNQHNHQLGFPNPNHNIKIVLTFKRIFSGGDDDNDDGREMTGGNSQIT